MSESMAIQPRKRAQRMCRGCQSAQHDLRNCPLLVKSDGRQEPSPADPHPAEGRAGDEVAAIAELRAAHDALEDDIAAHQKIRDTVDERIAEARARKAEIAEQIRLIRAERTTP